MNNNPEKNTNDNDIDDILDILQKKKIQDKKVPADDAPTRVTSTIIVPDKNAFTEKKIEQASMFGDKTSEKLDVIAKAETESDAANNKTTEIVLADKKDNTAVKADASEPQAVKVSDSAEKPASTKEESPAPVSSTSFSALSEGTDVKKAPTPPAPKPAPAPVKPSPEPSKQPAAKPTPKPAPVSQAPAKKPAPRGNYDSAPKVSLDDFDSLAVKPKKKGKINKNKILIPGYVKVVIYLVVVLSVSIFISASIISITNDVMALNKNSKEITVEINENATVKEVAKELEDKGVIKYPGIYKLYLKLRSDGGMDGKFLAGKHTLNSDMNYEQIIKILSVPNTTSEIVRVTIPEGYTVYELLDLLEEKNVIDKDGRKSMLEKLNDTSSLDYKFLPEMPETVKDDDGKDVLDTDKIYLLEGYLFPDTYDFYVGENIDSILAKLLNNFEDKFDESFYARCDELGMTVDEVITLASMIQAEGNNTYDFYFISNVFHNRLAKPAYYPKLESDATTVYAFQGQKDRNTLTADDIKLYDSPYNTYLNNGLPPGPVCNPGHDAIHAALYPRYTIVEMDEQGNTREKHVEYYFFYSSANTGKTYFSSSLAEHNRIIQQDKGND